MSIHNVSKRRLVSWSAMIPLFLVWPLHGKVDRLAASSSRDCEPKVSRQCDFVTARVTHLAGADLRGGRFFSAVLAGADLRGALLAGADLRLADLRGADLRGADLSNADLSSADLRGARLEHIVWRGAICPDGSWAGPEGFCAGITD